MSNDDSGEDMGFGGSSGSVQAPLGRKFEWAVRDFILGEKHAVSKDVLQNAREIGKVIKGSPNQTYSFMKRGIPNGITTNDPEILALCVTYAIDPAIPLYKQDRAKIAPPLTPRLPPGTPSRVFIHQHARAAE